MKKFVILIAIIAFTSAAPEPLSQRAVCQKPRGQCDARKMEMMQCVPMKCMQKLAMCGHRRMAGCENAKNQCMAGVDQNKLHQCHENQQKCEQEKGMSQCDTNQNHCMQQIDQTKMQVCHSQLNSCTKAATGKGKDCNVVMQTCMGKVKGYNACHEAMTACYNTQAQATPGDMSMCMNNFQSCTQQLKGMAKCGQKMQRCQQRSPMNRCYEKDQQCRANAGEQECQDNWNQCANSIERGPCDEAMQECQMKAGAGACETNFKACQATVDMEPCLRRTSKCIGEKNTKGQNCLKAFVQMKTMEHKPDSTMTGCMTAAGVNPKKMETTGDICKMAGCLVPKMASSVFQCYMNCHLNTDCRCSLQDPEGCAAIGEAHGSSSSSSYLELEDMETEQAWSVFFN